MSKIARDLRNGARNLFWRVVLGLSGCLIGAIGLGFLASWMYMQVSTVLGQQTASLLIGLGFSLLAGVLVLVASKHTPRPDPVHQADGPPKASDASSIASMAAFTITYVLARYAIGERRG